MKAQTLLRKPINAWRTHVDKAASIRELQETRDDLAALVQRAALLQKYIDGRLNYGHTDAADKANRQLVRIRKTMGFSYPERLPVLIAFGPEAKGGAQ